MRIEWSGRNQDLDALMRHVKVIGTNAHYTLEPLITVFIEGECGELAARPGEIVVKDEHGVRVLPKKKR